MLNDLKLKCEEDMISKLDENNILNILILGEKHNNIIS